MRFLGILLVAALFPVFLSLLHSRQGIRWTVVLLGALPFLHVPLNLDAALISWPTWPGHTKGLLLTIVDPLALAVCVRFARSQPAPGLIWVFTLYLVSLVPSLFVGELFQPAFFYFFQVCRLTILFYAVYLVVLRGGLTDLAKGMAYAIIINALFVAREALSGVTQAPGLLGHQNLTGMAVNLCVPLLITLGLRKKGGLLLVAVAAAGFSAVAGGSRATMIFYAVAVVSSLIGSTLVRPTSRKSAILAVAALGLLASSPLALHKLHERGVGLAEDLERIAFERAANMIVADHPWGVGANQYIVVANTQGYLTRAGVRWGEGARATNVHNFYLLARAEGGPPELLGVLSLFLIPFVTAGSLAFRKKNPARDVSIAIATAIAITAAHNRYEWIFVTIVPQYLFATMIGILAAIRVTWKKTRRAGEQAISNEAVALGAIHKEPETDEISS